MKAQSLALTSGVNIGQGVNIKIVSLREHLSGCSSEHFFVSLA